MEKAETDDTEYTLPERKSIECLYVIEDSEIGKINLMDRS